MLRQGLSEFRNNRNYQFAERWEEHADGTLEKKVVKDDGFGKRSLKHFGWKLNLGILEEVGIIRDADGKFLHFIDKSKEGDEAIIESLEQVIKSHEKFLEWQFENDSVEDVTNNETVFSRHGQNASNGDNWTHKKTRRPDEKFEET